MLALVAGPSGAGKDSVISSARTMLAGDSRFYFAQRLVTRMEKQTGEKGVSLAEFTRLQACGYFACVWSAHGLEYGLPRTELHPPESLHAQVIVANVSRMVIPDLLAEYGGHVLYVTASASEIWRRLAGRHRDSPESIQERFQRKIGLPAQLPMTTIQNDGPLEQASSHFVEVLLTLAG
jgi:phosphonate metabolism protein PhnN/1,5-bisphosphokinase (PRPP-forming)